MTNNTGSDNTTVAELIDNIYEEVAQLVDKYRGRFSTGRCRAALTVKGETFSCDLAAEHDGWAHSNQAAEAVWDGGVPR